MNTRSLVNWPRSKVGLTAILTLASILTLTERANAIPVFARKYETSCITCHAGFPKLNSVGEAFRRNGYQFPRGDFDLVKDDPIPLGTDIWQDMWPDSIWPNDLPRTPPIAFRARLGYDMHLDTPGGQPETDFQFPNDYSLLSAGTLGEDISWYAGYTLAGRGDNGLGEDLQLEGELERYFVQFSNLFAWDEEEDEDGMHLANRWLALPKHAMNLRIGQFEPGVIAPWASNHRRLGIQGRLPNMATIGGNSFTFEPAQRGIEIHGVLRNYWSYSVGLVNGNGVTRAWDNNSDKDVYCRIARKWWGYPLDGQVADIGGEAGGAEVEPEVEVGMRLGPRAIRLPSTAIVRGQDSMDDVDTGTPGLDFWRETSFETGVFGYSGRNLSSVTTTEAFEMLDTMGVLRQFEAVTITTRPNRFERIGLDARWTRRDLDIYGAWIWGYDNDPISDADPAAIEKDQFFTWFLEADYYFKPWLIGYARYEQIDYRNDARNAEASIGRGVVGAASYVRVNVKLVTEVVIDAKDNDNTTDSVKFLLDLAY